MVEDYTKISPTALMVANFRAKYTNMPFAQEIYQTARKFKGKSFLEVIAPVLGYLARFFPGSLERLSSLEGRYLVINEAIKKLGRDISLIEVASGLSARSLEWVNRDFVYLETDLPEMIKIKEQVFDEVAKSQGLRINPNHHFLPLNATNLSEWEKLGKKYFGKKSGKIAIIHEGLVVYLTREEQERLRDNIRNFLTTYSPNGAWITTDFSTQKRKESLLVAFAKKLIQRNTQREFNHFESPQDVVDFLNAGGLEVEILDNSSVFGKLTCVEKSRMDSSKVREGMVNYRAYYITLKK